MSEFYDQEQEKSPVDRVDQCPCCFENFLTYNQHIEEPCIENDDDTYFVSLECAACGFEDEIIALSKEVFSFDSLQFASEESIENDRRRLKNIKSGERLAEILREDRFIPPID